MNKKSILTRRLPTISILLLWLLLTAGCYAFEFTPIAKTPSIQTDLGKQGSYVLINQYPHDPNCYTQGLIFQQGKMYESCGLYGKSELREVDFENSEIIRSASLQDKYFAEGLALWQDKLFQLTWQEGTALVYRLEDFAHIATFGYSTQGWGLTTDGEFLIMSDGSDKLYWIKPENWQVDRQINVTLEGKPLHRLNELEYINGEVFANIYLTDNIVRIEPVSGEVLTVFDMTGLKPEENNYVDGEVLNGIAYNAETDRLFVTGKKWPWLYEIQLTSAATPTVIPLTTP